MDRHDDGSVTLAADEVLQLREVLHFLQQNPRSFAGSNGNRIYKELVEIRRGLGSTFYTP